MSGFVAVQSIKNHEVGKKHKETVERFFIEQRRKKVKDAREQQDIEKELAKIDKVGPAVWLVVATARGRGVERLPARDRLRRRLPLPTSLAHTLCHPLPPLAHCFYDAWCRHVSWRCHPAAADGVRSKVFFFGV